MRRVRPAMTPYQRRELVRAMVLFWSGVLAGGLAVCLAFIFAEAAKS